MMSRQELFRRPEILSVVVCLYAVCICTTETQAGIGASEEGSNPSTTTPYEGDSGGFEIIEDVTYDPGAGPWIKQLINSPGSGQIQSGLRVNITETLTNTGSLGWTDWHEEILTLTGGGGGGGGGTNLGFLFDKNSLTLEADYGAGFQPLVETVDYTVTEMEYLGPGTGDVNMGLEAVWIFFEPHAVIQSGDTLRIEKQIFEVFLDGNVWQPGEFVEIAQYPTIPIPEPSALTLAVLGLLGLCYRRRNRA